MSTVLLFQTMDESGMEILRDAGHTVIIPSSCDEDILMEAAAKCDAIIVRGMAKLNARVIQNAGQCKVIGRHGVGLDTIDVAEATRRHIPVVNTPGANANAVAEQAVSLMLDVLKNNCFLNDKMKRGRDYQIRLKVTNRELAGKTLGLIGLGNIGRTVAKICAGGFGMKVVGNDPFVTREVLINSKLDVELTDNIDEVISRADVLSLHAPPARKPLIGRRELALMKPGSVLINTARGDLIDEEALLDALKNGPLIGAGLDVMSKEPPPDDHPFYSLDNVVLLPHTAALTQEGNRNMAVGVAKQVAAVLAGEKPYALVNPEIWDSRRF